MKGVWLALAVLLSIITPQFVHAEVASLDAGATLVAASPSAEADSKPQIFAQLGLPSGCLAISADGQFALTGSENLAKLWEIASGREIRIFSGHREKVISVAFSPNGRYALSGSVDGVLKLWEIATGKVLQSIQAHSTTLDLPAVFSPDGRQALSGAGDGQIILWDLATGSNIRTMTSSKPGSVNSLAFSPDGRHALSTTSYFSQGIFTSGIRNDLRLWDVATGKLLRAMDGHANTIRSVAFSPDGRRALSGSWDKTVKLWDLATGREIRSMDHSSAWINSVAFAPDGKLALSTSNEGMNLWDLDSGRTIRTFGGSFSHAVFSPDGRQALGLSDALQTFDIATGRLIRRFYGNSPRYKATASTAFSPDGGRVVSGGKATQIWDVTTGKRILRVQEGDAFGIGMTSITFSPDGGQILSGHRDKTVKLRDAGTGNVVRNFEGHSGSVDSIAFSRDGKQALSSGSYYGDSVRLWDVATGETIRALNHPGAHYVALSPDGRQALSASMAGTMLWDLASGKALRSFAVPTREAVFSPDGRYVLLSTASPLTGVANMLEVKSPQDVRNFTELLKLGQLVDTSSSLKLFDPVTGQEIRSFTGHSRDVRSVAFSPDGTRALSGSMDHTLKLWDVATGREIRTFVGHAGIVDSVSFSPDGRLALSGSRDSSARIWDVATGKEIIQMVGFEDGEWIVITPDGYYNASPNGDKYLNVSIGNKVYGIENYREAFFRPDLVKVALSGGSLKGHRNIAQVKTPPQLELVDTPLTVTGDEVNVTVKLSDTGGGIGDVRLYLNGSAVMTDNSRGLKLVAVEKQPGSTRSYKIRLSRGENIIRAVAFNADNSMQSNPAEQTVTATFTPSAKPNLHALVIGINEFKNPKLRLQYAVPDADLFAETLTKGAAGLFGAVNVVRLTTPEQTSSANITSELKKMRSINPDDMFILFIASHGTVDDGEYFLITSNVGSTSTAKLKTDALSQNSIKELIANIPATKKVIMLDTCNAGQMGDAIQVALMTRGMSEDTAFKILSRAVGSTILSSATSTQEALEGYRGHGLFTWVLAEGMRGKADKGKSGYIKTTDLVDYVESEVPEIAETHFKRKQYPTTAVSGQGFPIGKNGL